ncbi:MAG: DoxX family protein [Bacteroidota bacterium]
MNTTTSTLKTATANKSNFNSKVRIVLFWIATGIVGLETAVGSYWDIAQIEFVLTVMKQLGYPAYFLTIMGIWKALGVVALLSPRLPLLKEWIYAGLVFVYTGAAASHLAVGEIPQAVGPLIFTGLTFASWALRPASRKFQAAK